MAKYDPVIAYYVTDFPRTLFPLNTNKVLIENAAADIGSYIYEKITHAKESDYQFLPQVRAYAAKPDFHLRRTLKLDPIAEFFFYDITYRHRTALRNRSIKNRKSFGYQFKNGRMISAALSYQEFRKSVHDALSSFSSCVKLDIAQYFNSLYHHDIVAWFHDYAKTNEDIDFLGKFLRQINAGRSVDCLPHGIYPAKIFGSQFLKYIDESNRLVSSLMLRFMDDIYLFDDDHNVILQDFHQIQRLLGERGLSVNSAKTQIGNVSELNIEREVDEIKARLLDHRGWIIFGSGAEDDDWDEIPDSLSYEEVQYLLELLRAESIEEEDAELVLSLLRENSGDVLEYIPHFLEQFPSLSKNLFYFSQHIDDKKVLLGMINDFISSSTTPTEYQLFWLTKLCEDELLNESGIGDVLGRIYEHPHATTISKAKVLEIPERRFGMPDLREEELRTGASGWLAWSAAVGSRKIRKASRNHLLGYFSNGSSINRLIADCVKRL
jgi:hypothetical protein